MELLEKSLGQGIFPAIVVAIFLVISKYLDNKKEERNIEFSNNLTNSINTIGNFIMGLTKNIIDKDKAKCKNAIEDSMYSSAMRLIHFVSTTIINNHIDLNKENILSNIHNIVNAEYYTIYSSLSLYTIDNHKVSNYLNKEWIQDIEKDMIDIIYNNSLSKEDKILSFTNKIDIRLQSYITYIINNTLKG